MVSTADDGSALQTDRVEEGLRTAIGGVDMGSESGDPRIGLDGLAPAVALRGLLSRPPGRPLRFRAREE